MLISIAYAVAMLYSFRFALSAELNQGVIASLFSMAPAFSAMIAYFMFSEKLKRFHVVGMILMFLCIIGLGIGAADRKTFQYNGEPFHDPLESGYLGTSQLQSSILSISLGII